MSSPPNAQYAPEICQWCKGTGYDRVPVNPGRSGRFQMCRICNGQGRVQVAQPSMPCVHCKGTGMNPNADSNRLETIPCTPCGSTGWSLRWIPPR